MDIEKLILLDELKAELKGIKAREMELRKEIMLDISHSYEGTKKSFDWVDPDLEGTATVTCDLKLAVDEDAYLEYFETDYVEELTPAEKACITKKITYTISKPALKYIDEESVIYNFIDSEPALSTIKYKLGLVG